MPRINNPCDWVIKRLKARRPFFTVRYNDGEMAMMYKTVPEGKVLGTDANPAPSNYELGKELRAMLKSIATRPERDDNVLIGCSWNTDRADDLGRGPFAEDVKDYRLQHANWCNEHWPLDGVVDGSTQRMIWELRTRPVILATCETLVQAQWCLESFVLDVPASDSWSVRDEVYRQAITPAKNGCTFVWAAGCGLKPTAWRLFQEFPQSSHVDVGHLFNGAFGLRDYGWLQRQDGPWWEPYFRPGGFADWVRRFVP